MTDQPIDRPDTDVIQEAIGMDARQVQFRLPDETEPLPDALRAEICAAVRAHCKQHKLTLREVGQTIGYHLVTVNQVLQGKYRGPCDPVLRSMASYLNDDIARRSRQSPQGFVQTTVVDAIKSLAQYAKDSALSADQLDRNPAMLGKPRIMVGYGPAGCGKSVAAEAYVRYDPRAILVRVAEGRRKATALAALICDGMMSRGARRPKASVEFVLTNLRGSQRLIIVDEGHRLGFSQCEFLRDLADTCGVPILILATEEFYERLASVRRRSGRYNYDQFTSRVGAVFNLLKGADGTGGSRRPYFSLDQIVGMFRRADVRFTADALDYLQAIACTPGCGMLRTASTVVDKAARYASKRNRVIDLKLLQESVAKSLTPPGVDDDEIGARFMAELAEIRKLTGRASRNAERAAAASA